MRTLFGGSAASAEHAVATTPITTASARPLNLLFIASSLAISRISQLSIRHPEVLAHAGKSTQPAHAWLRGEPRRTTARTRGHPSRPAQERGHLRMTFTHWRAPPHSQNGYGFGLSLIV